MCKRRTAFQSTYGHQSAASEIKLIAAFAIGIHSHFGRTGTDGIHHTINGDGKQSRDFTYIENVIEANLKACLAPEEANGQVFNVAYGGREYLIDIYYSLTKALGKNIEPHFGPDRPGDIKHSNADISKAKRLLGYDPQYDFAKGLAEAISWYRENL